jgi:hypothetical protein
MIYIGIDVGVINLAIVKCVVEDFKVVKVIEAHRVNLNELPHTAIPRHLCTLEHSNDAYDKLQHLFQEYGWLFSDVDQVRIERQPINGLVHIEQLLFGHFRSKAKLISPNSMHKHFNIQHYDYEGRKQQTTKIAWPYLSQIPDWNQERVHDMADALCILLYALCVERRQHNEIILKKHIEEEFLTRQRQFGQTNYTSLNEFFDQFKYQKVISAKDWLSEKYSEET